MATTRRSGPPTAVSVRIGFHVGVPTTAVDTVLQFIRAHRFSHSGPTPTDRGEIWEVCLSALDVPGALHDLEAFLWAQDAVRQTVITHL
jgi:hypothetical protein